MFNLSVPNQALVACETLKLVFLVNLTKTFPLKTTGLDYVFLSCRSCFTKLNIYSPFSKNKLNGHINRNEKW
jgi:hypothetical protein